MRFNGRHHWQTTRRLCSAPCRCPTSTPTWSSMSCGQSEAVGNSFSHETCEHALANSPPDKVEAAYGRGDLFDKRVPLMQAWADYCMSKVGTMAGPER